MYQILFIFRHDCYKLVQLQNCIILFINLVLMTTELLLKRPT